MDVEGREVTLHTTDADAILWSLYGHRDDLSGLEVTGGGLREAFLAGDPGTGVPGKSLKEFPGGGVGSGRRRS
jgi:hypothetical protein